MGSNDTTEFKHAKKNEARKQQNNIFKIQRDSNCQIRILHLVKLSFKNGVKQRKFRKIKNSIFHKRCINEGSLKDIFLAESRKTRWKRECRYMAKLCTGKWFCWREKRTGLELKHERKLPDVLECIYQSYDIQSLYVAQKKKNKNIN